MTQEDFYQEILTTVDTPYKFTVLLYNMAMAPTTVAELHAAQLEFVENWKDHYQPIVKELCDKKGL